MVGVEALPPHPNPDVSSSHFAKPPPRIKLPCRCIVAIYRQRESLLDALTSQVDRFRDQRITHTPASHFTNHPHVDHFKLSLSHQAG